MGGERLKTDGELKECGVCREMKPICEFPTYVDRKKGKVVTGAWCRLCKRKYKAGWQKKNRIKNSEYKQRYLAQGKKVVRYDLAWRKRNPEKQKLRSASRKYQAIKNNPTRLMRDRIRGRMSMAIKAAGLRVRIQKSKLRYLGCSAEQAASYISMLWQKGMNWENYGRRDKGKGWEIDHVMPLCTFDLALEEDRRSAFHYTNLQPLWADENRRKKKKTRPQTFQPYLLFS